VSATREVATPLGPARVLNDGPADAVTGTLVLGGGAGGGVDAPDLTAVTEAAADAGWRVHRVEQPWRVAGKRIAPAPARLDIGWAAVLDALRADGGLTGPLVLGGRSAGARVACRSAAAQGAAGVLALAFPLHPPTRPLHPPPRPSHPSGRPDRSRAAELAAVDVPVLVVQGERDPFGGPAEVAAAVPGVTVRGVPGDHGLKQDLPALAAAVLPWLSTVSGEPDGHGRRD
jgi:predicted alpha/beta-hydrolase family hydrolase